MPEIVIGKVTEFFARPVVAGIELNAPLKVGDRVHIKGHTTDLEFAVGSMQVDNVNVDQAKAGDNIGIKVSDRVRRGDIAYKITD
ncbi:MAG: translation elongation factor-like protein [Dehalococcoidales bacterium]|nr:translation elongation factor-like protein [Dehalococcoidales bacterium]